MLIDALHRLASILVSELRCHTQELQTPIRGVNSAAGMKTVSGITRIFSAILVAILLYGCQTQEISLTAGQRLVRAELQSVDPSRDSLVARTPIVDIHTHTFNTRYLPLEGILLGKRDAFPPVTWLISDRCARMLAQALVDRTQLASAGGMPAVSAETSGRMLHETVGVDPVCKIFLKLLNKAAVAGAWNEDLSPETQMQNAEAVADQMNLQERIAIRAATHMMGMEESIDTPDPGDGLKAAVRFLWMITQSDGEMARLFRSQYSGVRMRGKPLMVSHMIDLAPVHDQEPDGEALLRFRSQQIRRMEAYQNRPDSGLIYFVAYNPYRDHWLGGRPGDALRVVQWAVRNHGAWGVKVYPPSGYRPAENKIRPRALALLSRRPGAQWDARYAGLDDPRNEVLDRRLEKLLLWCIEEDVPVFVHSGTGEFEARRGYGVYHSNPRFWRRFLESHPEPDGSPCRLRLCLGHAGGNDFWYGGEDHLDWGREAYDLCREFPNVYCEITTHGELTESDRQAYFVDQLATLFSEPAGRHVAGHRYPYRFPFSSKLVYGTDWYLPEAAERRQILRATQQAFLHEKLRPFYRDYFSGNAFRFLNVRARLRDTRNPVAPAVRERLSENLSAIRDN